MHFHEYKFCFFIQISLKLFPNGPTDNTSAFVRVMSWKWIGDKPLPEPMLIQFIDIYATLGGDELIYFRWYFDTEISVWYQ